MATADDITLNKFSEAISDLARPNRFIVSISDNSIMRQYLPRDVRGFDDLKFFVTNTSLPPIDITGPEINYFGTKMMLAGDPKFEPLTITFLNAANKNNEWKVRQLFELWMKYIVNYTDILNEHGNGNLEYRNGSTITIEQIDKTYNTIATYEFYNCVPLNIGAIEFDMNAENSVENFDVTFHYTYYKRLENG